MTLLRATGALLLVLLLGGSGAALAQDASPSPAGTAPSGSTGMESPAPGTDVMPVDQIEIGAVEYAFVGVPEDVPTGTAFRLRNDGQEVHEFAVARRNEGTEQSVEELLDMGDEASTLVTFVGIIFAAPGEVSADTLTVSEPGRYIAVCFIPQGTTELPPGFAGPDETGTESMASPDPAASPDALASPEDPTSAASPDAEAGAEGTASPDSGLGDGPPHAALGMIVEFTVGGEGGPTMDTDASPEVGAPASPEASPAG
ncbi:hypothetical protein BH24CHL9_BH24CHL9_12960 [soil metagenome]